ncbi:MAG TPA: DNA-directed RNA polymerase subunit H [Candidatus Nanoarchaeia archaeon]|nr:DNA-directed RNA polymerase subunit H [Candidatus Nanoarchaeia archaeon]
MDEKKIDLTKHIFVPKHLKLTEEEKKEFLEAYNLNKSQVPRIQKEDPAIQHLEPKKGDAIKITRKSPTIGESTFYRVVI